MKCALCLEDRTLCNSHIVPEFFFKRMKEDADHFFVVGEKTDAKKFYRSFSEKLLCQSCENLFSRWEAYADRFFDDRVPLTGRAVGKHFFLEGAEYAPLKLFLMSVLWRFGLTTIPFWTRIQLGPHEERLRKMLLSADPGECWRYGCTITGILAQNELARAMIVSPTRTRIRNHRVVRIIAGGFMFCFLVTSHRPPAEIESLLLQENGALVVSRADVTEIAFLWSFVQSVKDKIS